MVDIFLKEPPPLKAPHIQHVPAPSYLRIWGQTEWPEADQAKHFTTTIANNTVIMSSDGSVKGRHGSTGWTLEIQTGLMTSDGIQKWAAPVD